MKKQIVLIVIVALFAFTSALYKPYKPPKPYKPVVSSGRCPRNVGQGNGQRCFSDNECSLPRICCGRRGVLQPGYCTYPRGLIGLPAEKDGVCPRPRGFGICVQRCSNDFECPGNQKCCSNGCGRVCTTPWRSGRRSYVN